MKRSILILFVLFCSIPVSHAQESEPPRTITLDRRAGRLVWSPDSRYIAFLAVNDEHDTNIQVVDVSTGQLIADFDYEPDIMVWSPDSTRLAVNAGRDTGPEFPSMVRDVPISILDVKTGGETTIGSDANVNGLGWSPDGTRLAVTTNRYETSDAYKSTLQVWDVASGAVIVDLIQDDFAFVNYYWYAPVWSPDGTRLAIPNASGLLAVWDVKRQKEVFSLWGFPEDAHNVAWSPSGDRIAASGNDVFRIWDATTGEPLSAFPGSTSELRWIADDQLVVVKSDHISFIDPLSGRARGMLEVGADLTSCRYRWEPCIVWSPDGQSIAHADDNEIRIFSPIYSPVESNSPQITLTLAHSIPPILSTLPTATEPITPTNADRLTFLGQFGRDDIRDALWSPDGSTIALLGTHGVWLYDDPTLSQPPHLLEIANGTVSSMLFSPDSRYLVLAVQNKTNHDFGVRFWDIHANKLAKVLEGHTAPVTAMDFSADGGLLATGSADLTIRLWNVEIGEPIHVLWGHVDDVLSVDFSPDSRLLVSAGDSTLRVWDVEKGEVIGRGNGDWSYEKQDPRVVNAQFTPDGKRIYFFYLNLNGEYVNLRTWSPDSDTNWDLGIFPFGHSGFVGTGRQYELAFSPNGTKMIPYTRYGSWLSMLDVNTREAIKQWWMLGCIISSGAVAFSPDGSELAIGVTRNQACDPFPQNEPKTIWLWNLQTGERRAVLSGQSAAVDRLVYSPDGRWLLSVSTDNTTRLWDVTTAEALQVITDFRNPASHLTFDPTGALASLEIARDSVVMRRDEQLIYGMYGGVYGGPNSPIDRIIPNQDFSAVIVKHQGFSQIFPDDFMDVSVWNAGAEKHPFTFSGKIHDQQSAAVNPSGTLLASSKDGVVRLWELETETEQTVLMDEPNLRIPILAFSPDGQTLAGIISSSVFNAVKLWELTTGAQRSIVLPDSATNLTALTFSPGSRYLAAQTSESDVWILSLGTNTAAVVLHPGVETIRYIAFSHNSALIALATDEAIQLWDRAAGMLLASLPVSSVSLAFNQEDTLLASGESDGTIRLWGIQ